MMLHEHLLLLLHSPGEEGEGKKKERERDAHGRRSRAGWKESGLPES